MCRFIVYYSLDPQRSEYELVTAIAKFGWQLPLSLLFCVVQTSVFTTVFNDDVGIRGTKL